MAQWLTCIGIGSLSLAWGTHWQGHASLLTAKALCFASCLSVMRSSARRRRRSVTKRRLSRCVRLSSVWRVALTGHGSTQTQRERAHAAGAEECQGGVVPPRAAHQHHRNVAAQKTLSSAPCDIVPYLCVYLYLRHPAFFFFFVSHYRRLLVPVQDYREHPGRSTERPSKRESQVLPAL